MITNLIKIKDLKIKFPYQAYETQKDQMNFLISQLEKNDLQQNLFIESPSGTGKTLTQICSIWSWIQNHRQQQNSEKKNYKIIYVCQNYNQMDKVVDEINKSEYRPNVLIRKSNFRYYQEEKINDIINQQNIEKNLQEIQKSNLAELTEKLLYVYIQDDKQKQVANLQQFEKNCEKTGIHPFLASQILQDKFDILITVSKFFFDDQFLKFQKNWLQDKIIIYDQGHDLAGVCEEMAGVTLNNQDLKNILEILEDEQYKDQGKFLVPELKNLVDQIENQNLMDIGQLKQVDCFFYDLFLKDLKEKYLKKQSLYLLLQKIDNNSLKQYFEQYLMLKNEQYQIFKIYLDKFQQLSEIIKNQEKDLYMINKQNEGSDLNLVKMNINCLTPSKKFKQVSDQNPKCSIISSCSLTPFYILQNSLGIENCEQFQGSYMTNANKQLFGGLVMNQYERSENIYNFSQKRIEEDKQNVMSNDLGRYIKNIIQYIPNGCIIAFSNKFILENTYQQWNRNRIITYNLEKQCQILGNKEVIYDNEIGKGLFSLKCNLCDKLMGKKIEQQFDDIEVQNDIKCQNCQRTNIKFQLECNKHKQQQICEQCALLEENVLENYKKKAKTEEGAILLTVCKSKNFYDQNFEGELLRGLFMVGLPYFQFNEVVQEKIQFNSFINNNSDWYKQQMYRQIYSALGRVIRNKDDWGAIYLFDSRFSQNVCDFPKYFRDTYKIYQTSGKLIDDTKLFFEGYGCKIQNNNKGIIINNLNQGSKNRQSVNINNANILSILNNQRLNDNPIKFMKSNQGMQIQKSNDIQNQTIAKNQQQIVYDVQLYIKQNKDKNRWDYKYQIFDYFKKNVIQIKEDSIPSDSNSIQINLGKLIQNIAHEIKKMENQPYKVIFEVQDEKFVQIGNKLIMDKKVFTYVEQIKQTLEKISLQLICNKNLQNVLKF